MWRGADLDSMIVEYNKTAKPPPQAASVKTSGGGSFCKRTPKTTSNLRQSRDKMNSEVLAKLEQKICQHKDELWWFWKESDVDDSGLITVAKWRQGMTTMLHLDIPWQSLEDELARPDDKGVVDYRQFLDRIRNNAMAEGLKSVDGGWEKQMVVKVYETIIRSDMTLKQTIAEFDPDGDGKVSAWEFRKVGTRHRLPAIRHLSFGKALHRETSSDMLTVCRLCKSLRWTFPTPR